MSSKFITRIFVFIIVNIIFLFLIIEPALAKYIELLDADNGYKKVESFPYDHRYEIVVAGNEGEDIRRWLPITIKIQVGDNVLTDTIPNTPQAVCRGADGCSIPGPVIKSEARGLSLKITAYDKNGSSMGSYSEIIYSPKKNTPLSPKNIPTIQITTSEKSPKLISTPSANPAAALVLLTLLAVGAVGLGMAIKNGGAWIIPKGKSTELKEEEGDGKEHENCRTIREKKNELVRKIKELQQQIDSLRAKINSLTDQIKAMRKRQEAIDEKIKVLDAKITQDKLMKSNYESALAGASSSGSTKEVKEKIDNYDQKIKAAEAERDSLQKEKINLEDQIDKVAADALSLSQKIANLEEQQISILNEIIKLAKKYKECITAECQPGQQKLGDTTIPHVFVIPDGEKEVQITQKGLVGGGVISPEEAEQMGKTAKFISWLEHLIPGGVGKLPLSELFSYIDAAGDILDALAKFARGRQKQDYITITAEIPVKIYAWQCKQKYVCLGGQWDSFGEGHRIVKVELTRYETKTVSGSGQGPEAALKEFIINMMQRKDQFDKAIDEWQEQQLFCRFD